MFKAKIAEFNHTNKAALVKMGMSTKVLNMNTSETLRQEISDSPMAKQEMIALANDCHPACGVDELSTKIAEVVDPLLEILEKQRTKSIQHTICGLWPCAIQKAVIRTLEIVLDDIATGDAIDSDWVVGNFRKKEV